MSRLVLAILAACSATLAMTLALSAPARATTIFGPYTWTGTDNGDFGYSGRQYVAASGSTSTLNQIRVTITATAGSLALYHVGVCQPTVSGGDTCVATPIEVTFNTCGCSYGGGHGVSLTAGQVAVSDWITVAPTIPVGATQLLLTDDSADSGWSGTLPTVSASGLTFWAQKCTTSCSANPLWQQISGLANGNGNVVFIFSQVETQSTGGSSSPPMSLLGVGK
jgi:hypothetical protein